MAGIHASGAIFAASAVLLISAMLFCGITQAAGLDSVLLSPLIGMKPLDGVPMGGMFANERINIYVEGEPVGNIVLVDGAITEAGIAPLDDPTMNIYASAQTVASVAMGQKTLGQCFLDGEIRYEGVGAFNSLKTFFASIGIWFYNLFN